MTVNAFFKRRNVNIDLSFRCPIECPRCRRQYYYKSRGLAVPGKDLTLDDFNKVVKFFDYINFEGQSSDPIHNVNFIKFLEILYCLKKPVEIHTASSAKPLEWYKKAFLANPNAEWVFSIDGLPEESHIYRVNQDGVKLFNIMVESKKYLKVRPKWQYIVFSYNENHIDQAIDMAANADVDFYILQSSRWIGDDDPLMPSEKYRMSIKSK
jgi:MoaA/NifB/PqqE/SkfB family radical SAM enzyme